MKVYRCYTEKRKGFDVTAKAVQRELAEVLSLPSIRLRLFNRYDVSGFADGKWDYIISTVLSEPNCDAAFKDDLPELGDAYGTLLCIEALPGQFDVRAESCSQCIQMLLGGERPAVKTARVYAIGGIDGVDFERVKAYLINPVEEREAGLNKPDEIGGQTAEPPDDIPSIDGFINMDETALERLRSRLGLAMSLADLTAVRDYFISENRNPILTELRVLDTYWSDHCRHTTFNTVIESAEIEDERVKAAFEQFLFINGDKPVTFMNMATAAMRYSRKRGELPMLHISEENNACTIEVEDSGGTPWLFFFKNETHNHPTEIEPFGGASTCIGGAIRDPLSGRGYVYQSMRISGAGDPRKPIKDTLQGKLPQRKLTVTAAEGFSSYGNQIGIATGFVKEIYHDGYVAKRLEAGAVVGAAPKAWVRKDEPSAGDVVVLLGGRTGRDGIGGATGSSKTHGSDTVAECSSEVQKGNAPEERKLQRLFRNPDVTRLIKRCNDFGAGGASVAIGELADGVEITLDNFPVKYDGLNGTELAISESQERMAVVVEAKDADAIKAFAEEENIEATIVAKITGDKTLTVLWRGNRIVNIKRSFLDTNGAERTAAAHVTPQLKLIRERLDLPSLVKDLNFCSQKGLVNRFDHSIGAGSILEPYGGKHLLTETQVMAALFPSVPSVPSVPSEREDVTTVSLAAFGYDPCLTSADPFGGSVSAVVTSVAKLIAVGAPIDTIHLSLQEFFMRLENDPKRWGVVFAAMLGAVSAQLGLKIAAIGGKDSMSGSYNELDVPPTLISFAFGIGDARAIITPEFKKAGNPVYILETPLGKDGLPDYAALTERWGDYAKLSKDGKVKSAFTCEVGGASGALFKMCVGNMIGFKSVDNEVANETVQDLFGSIVFETDAELDGGSFRLIGHTATEPAIILNNSTYDLNVLVTDWESALEKVFPTEVDNYSGKTDIPLIQAGKATAKSAAVKFAKPKAVIPVFPGTNCEYDTALAIEKAGGTAETVLIRNLSPLTLDESVLRLEKALSSAQMLIFPGGFSGGDEPDGSGKFIASLFRNARLTDAVHSLLQKQDGLILGICNGFQALMKLGLLPHGEISPINADSPALTFNRIGRHQACYVNTRICSSISPWLSKCDVNAVYTQPVSHGEGRIAASDEQLAGLRDNGQIVFQYVDLDGNPSMLTKFNPNGSDWAVEGICSPDGRVLGKMAHTERYGELLAKNVYGDKVMPLFDGGVGYFK